MKHGVCTKILSTGAFTINASNEIEEMKKFFFIKGQVKG